MKHKKFKIKEELAATDLLMHAISVYDLAATLAAQDNNIELILAAGDKITEASDRLIALALQTEEEENNERTEPTRKFGFTSTEDHSSIRPEGL